MPPNKEPVYLGPMARSIVETFSHLTVAQQRQVLDMLTDIVTANEQADQMMLRLLAANEESEQGG